MKRKLQRKRKEIREKASEQIDKGNDRQIFEICEIKRRKWIKRLRRYEDKKNESARKYRKL